MKKTVYEYGDNGTVKTFAIWEPKCGFLRIMYLRPRNRTLRRRAAWLKLGFKQYTNFMSAKDDLDRYCEKMNYELLRVTNEWKGN